MESVFMPEAQDLADEFRIGNKLQMCVCMTGAPGVGKSFFAHAFARSPQQRGLELGRGFFQANITKSTDPRMLIGKMLVSGNGSISMDWQDGDLTLAIKAGGVFLADELNRGAGELQNRFFSVTETGYRYLTIFEQGNTIVPVPKDFFLIATQNPPNSKFYNAPLDKALSERFIHYDIDKPLADEAKLCDLMLPKTKWANQGERLFTVAEDSRKAVKEIGMSTRSLAQIGRLIGGGMRPLQAYNVAWLNRFDDKEESEAAKAVLTTHFTTELESKALESEILF